MQKIRNDLHKNLEQLSELLRFNRLFLIAERNAIKYLDN